MPCLSWAFSPGPENRPHYLSLAGLTALMRNRLITESNNYNGEHAGAKSPGDTKAMTAMTALAKTAATAALLLAVGVTAHAAPAAAAAGPHRSASGVMVNCTAAPSACGYPDATNSGVPAGTALKTVPGQVSSGPGWHYDSRGWVEVTGTGTVLSGLYIPYNLDIEASGVTIKDSEVVTGGPFGISLRHTAGVTVEHSTVSGTNLTTGRVNSAIADVYGDSTAMTFKDDNIADFRIGIQAGTGLVEGNYIHDPGYQPGDHTNGITATGSAQPMTITGNTVLNTLGQTDAITLDASATGQAVANKTVTGNLLAGGSYSIYGGAGNNATTSNIIITGNRFSQQYFPQAGQYGPIAYFNAAQAGNVWSANIWDTTGNAIAS